MIRQTVSSSSIASVGYEPVASLLEVQFRGGGTYIYFHVPESEYVGLLSAGSHGRYFAQYVKDRYIYSRVS